MGLRKKLRKWLNVVEPFTAEKFARQERFRDDYRVVAESLLEVLDFESVIDLGCANGLLLRELHGRGKTVRGIELAPSVRRFVPAELRSRIEIGDFTRMRGEADLVCCMEMAEHIPRKRSEELVATIASLARRWVYFTAAPPGQPGHGHVNCRPLEEWVTLYRARGWEIDPDRTDRLRSRLGTLRFAGYLGPNSVILGRRAPGP